MVTIKELRDVAEVTELRANPHRIVDWERLQEAEIPSDAEVSMRLVFVEEHNTGYEGHLERYLCSIINTKVRFQIDLLPSLIVKA
jgi:hypothetical protein